MKKRVEEKVKWWFRVPKSIDKKLQEVAAKHYTSRTAVLCTAVQRMWDEEIGKVRKSSR